MKPFLQSAMDRCPLVAILRGVKPAEAGDIGRVLIDAGFAIIEVPLNSPEPLKSIETIAKLGGHETVVGAGTVLDAASVAAIGDAGGRLIVAPNADRSVVSAAVDAGMATIPGIFTPSEAFAMLGAGADALKLFPGEIAGPAFIKALKAVLPSGTNILPVGGVSVDTLSAWRAAGASGAGIGTALYSPGTDAAEVARRAKAFVQAWRQVVSGEVRSRAP